MKLKMKNKELNAIDMALLALNQTPRLPYKISYARAHNANLLRTFSRVYHESLSTIARKYAIVEGTKIKTVHNKFQFESPEKEDAFLKERNETLDSIETEIDFYMFEYDWFVGVDVHPDIIKVLFPLITPPSIEAKKV